MTFLSSLGLVVPFVVLVMLAGVAWRAWWLYPAWSWYVVPLGLPPIRFWHFAALVLLIDTFRTIRTKKDDRKEEWKAVLFALAMPILAYWLLRWMR